MESYQRNNGRDNVPRIKPRTGIIGIERSILEKQKATNESISTAFQDLNKLMIKAKDMVNLSKNISNKLKEKQGGITDDETVRFKSYLLSLGIDEPVTRDTYRSDEEYFRKLAKEILNIIENPVNEAGGVMVLTDAYCRVNRARGLALLSPEDFLCGCSMLESLGMPIVLREFDSGVKVLQSSAHNETVIAEDTVNILKQTGKLNAEELARMLGISVILAKQRFLIAEKHGKACRDDTIEGLIFYPNKLLENDGDE